MVGSTALISGSSGGLGYATARALASRGATVVLTETPERFRQAEDAAHNLSELGGRAVPLSLDLRSTASIAGCVAECLDRFQAIDILVNNAGVNIRKPALQLSPEDWDEVLNVNLRGAFILCQECGRHMASRRHGKIINVASIFGLVGGTHRVAYAASKAGLISLTRCLALEWADLGIQVNAVAPTFAETPLTSKLLSDPAERENIVQHTPANRLALPEEVARTILFLATPGVDIITGATIAIDGGWTAE